MAYTDYIGRHLKNLNHAKHDPGSLDHRDCPVQGACIGSLLRQKEHANILPKSQRPLYLRPQICMHHIYRLLTNRPIDGKYVFGK
jgi:hypothetical protein